MSTKTVIGSGKPAKYDAIRVSIRMKDAMPFVRQYETGSYLSFILSKRKETDEHGRTHTAFVIGDATPIAAAEPAAEVPAEKPKKRARRQSRVNAVAEPTELFGGNEME